MQISVSSLYITKTAGFDQGIWSIHSLFSPLRFGKKLQKIVVAHSKIAITHQINYILNFTLIHMGVLNSTWQLDSLHTVKSRALDRSTIQFLTLWAKGHKFPLHISSVVKFQRWWVIQSKIFPMWWPGFKDFIGFFEMEEHGASEAHKNEFLNYEVLKI